jgi:hypothetical protein
MKALIGILIGTTLLIGSGCAKQDWIDRTLVTVDVTGTWGMVEGLSTSTSFELEQRGSTVKGFIRAGTVATTATISGPIDGTVAGDVFRFRSPRGDVEGELTVSGDEMTGMLSRAGAGIAGAGSLRISLRRVDPSSPLASPPR